MGLQYMRGVISYNVDVLADHPRKYLRRIKSNADTFIFSYRCKYRCFSYSVLTFEEIPMKNKYFCTFYITQIQLERITTLTTFGLQSHFDTEGVLSFLRFYKLTPFVQVLIMLISFGHSCIQYNCLKNFIVYSLYIY